MQHDKKFLIIDFDSTFVSVEALDELARIALRGKADRVERVAKIEQITKDGMEGNIGFAEALVKRLALFQPTQRHISELVNLLRERVTESLEEEFGFFAENADRIYVISGGFREYIVPVVQEYGIAPGHVLANTFVTDAKGNVTGCDEKNPMSQDGGKVTVLTALGLDGHVVMVGDGYSDYQTRDAGASDEFIAFIENVDRPSITSRADHVAHSFSDVIKMVELSDTIEV